MLQYYGPSSHAKRSGNQDMPHEISGSDESNYIDRRLQWSRGSVLPKFAGSNLAEAIRIFQGKKNLSAPSFRGEVKRSVPCLRFAACKRYLHGTWKLTFRQNYQPTFSPTVPPFAARISRVVWT